MNQIDSTLRQLLAEIYANHREIEVLRRRVAELEAAQQAARTALEPPPGGQPDQKETP